MAIDLTKQVGMTSPVAQSTTAATNMPWKSYDQYFKDKGQSDLASQYGAYHSNYMPGTTDNLNWGATGNPYRFSEEYNQYKSTLPQQYQDLINYGINPADVASGKINKIGSTPIQLPGGGVAGAGAGSSFSLGEDVLSRMWR